MAEMTSFFTDGEADMSVDEAAILTVAACDGSGEFRVQRGYNKSWGADYATVKRLEAKGLMTFKSYERVPLTMDFVRTSQITDDGCVASRHACGVAE